MDVQSTKRFRTRSHAIQFMLDQQRRAHTDTHSHSIYRGTESCRPSHLIVCHNANDGFQISTKFAYCVHVVAVHCRNEMAECNFNANTRCCSSRRRAATSRMSVHQANNRIKRIFGTLWLVGVSKRRCGDGTNENEDTINLICCWLDVTNRSAADSFTIQ